MADITSSGGQSTDALNGKLNFQQSKNRIIGVDSNEDIRLLISAQDDDFAMKISRDGYDATVASDEELIFNSDNNLFKIVQSGVANVTAPGSGFTGLTTITTTVLHGLGKTPASLVYVTNPVALTGVGYQTPGLTAVPSTTYITNSGSVLLVATSRVDTTNIYFDLTYLSGGAGDIGPVVGGMVWAFKYYIMVETAS